MKKIIFKTVMLTFVLLQILNAQAFDDSTFSKVRIPNSSRQTIYGRIVDESGNPLIAQVQVWHYPLTKVVFAFGNEPVKGRTDNLIGITYSTAEGFYAIKVPADTITLIITKGPEWSLVKERIVINKNEFDGIEINTALKHLYNLSKLGWYGGDTHHHSLHSDGKQTPSQIALAMKGVGLSWGILSDHNSVSGNKEWISNSTRDFIAIPGNEITTEPSNNSLTNGYGHLNQTFISRLNGSFPSLKNIWARAVFSDHNSVQSMIDETHLQNGLISINHPYTAWNWPGRFQSWGKVKNFDAIEIWNGEPPHTESLNKWDSNKVNINTWAVQTWFSFLNSGNKISGFAGSDCHDIYGTNSYPKGEFYWTTTTGNPRTYTFSKRLDIDGIKNGLKGGNIFLTSGFGPLLLIDVNGKKPGEIAKVPSSGYINVAIKVLSNQPMLGTNDGIRIIVDGEVIKKIATVPSLTCSEKHSIKIEKDGWVIVQTFGQWPMYAITNPIYLDLPPYGDYPKKEFLNPPDADDWNKFLSHPAITIPDGPASWRDVNGAAKK